DDELAVELAGGPQTVEQRTDCRVGVGDLRVVRLMPRGERFGRAIRLVGIVEVDPREPGAGGWLLGAGRWLLVARRRRLVAGGWLLVAGCGRLRDGRIDPGERGFDDVLRAALGPFGGIARVLLAIAVVVDVEASREAQARVQHERSHERSGPVPGVP